MYNRWLHLHTREKNSVVIVRYDNRREYKNVGDASLERVAKIIDHKRVSAVAENGGMLLTFSVHKNTVGD